MYARRQCKQAYSTDWPIFVVEQIKSQEEQTLGKTKPHAEYKGKEIQAAKHKQKQQEIVLVGIFSARYIIKNPKFYGKAYEGIHQPCHRILNMACLQEIRKALSDEIVFKRLSKRLK